MYKPIDTKICVIYFSELSFVHAMKKCRQKKGEFMHGSLAYFTLGRKVLFAWTSQSVSLKGWGRQ